MSSTVPGSYDAELCTGDYMDLSAPEPGVITLQNVAEPLGRLCRYNGQCDRFYSVAEHACLCAEYALRQKWPREVVAAVLHHDDAEAFTGDITRPIKQQAPPLKRIEAEVMQAVCVALGMTDVPFDDPRVKYVDDWALMSEALTMMPSRGANWEPTTHITPEEPFWRLGWPPEKATRMFLFYDKVIGGRRYGLR